MDIVKSADSDVEQKDIPCLCSQRWILGYLGFLFGSVMNIYRTDINIAIVCMASDIDHNITEHYVNVTEDNVNFTQRYVNVTDNADNTTLYDGPFSSFSSVGCSGDIREKGDDLIPEFVWDRGTQSHVLSAYFYGFVISQIPGSWCIGRFGGKNVVTATTTVAAITTLLIPVLARASVIAVIIARVVVGITSAPMPVAWVSLVGKWALPNERSRMMMVYWCGQTIGAIFGYATSGFLCIHGFDHGWGSIFYLHGSIGIVFVLLWVYFTSNTPETHPRITDREKAVLVRRLHSSSVKPQKIVRLPLKEMFTSLSVWAIIITHVCDNSTFYLVVICLPLFAKEVLKFDAASNGVYTSLPFLTRSASLLCTAILADFINTKQWVSRTCNRKLFQLTSMLGSASFLVLASYIPCDQRQIVILLICFSTFFQSMGLSAGFPCNLVDMTPRYASFIYSLSNTLGASTGFIVPLGVAYLTQHKTMEEWRFVFWLTAGIAILGSIVYGLFSSSELVPWDRAEPQELEINIEEKQTLVPSTKHIQEREIIIEQEKKIVFQLNGLQDAGDNITLNNSMNEEKRKVK